LRASPTPVPAAEPLSVVGQIDAPLETVRARLDGARSLDDLSALLSIDGNFLLVYRRAAEVFIVNSLYSLTNYFYAEQGGRFFHADTLHALLRQGPLERSWNFEGIADLLGLQHVIDNETLLRGVRAVPMGAVLHWDGRRLSMRVHDWREFCEPEPGSGREIADRLIELTLDGLQRGVGSRPVMTASAGLDSRVNLAGLLHLGIRPELAVMGQPGSKDAEVVLAIGRTLGLSVNRILPEARDLIAAAAEVSRLTNGVKPLNNWHTFITAAKAGYGYDDRVFTGNNGEHVRAVGCDYGVLAHGLDGLSRIDSGALSRPLLRAYWARKRWLPLRREELGECAEEFAHFYGSERQIDRFMAVMPRMGFVWQCDSFVLEQRRKGFQAAGLQLYRARFPVYSPFLNKRWIDAGWSLPLGWRLDSRWHRYAIARLYPRLVEFPEEHERTRLRVHRRPLHWMPGVKRLYRSPPVVPYVDYDALLRRDDVLALLHDNASELDGFISRRLVGRVVDEQRRTGQRARLFSVLAGMALWRATLH
jgi:hypothetical protein